MDLLDELEAESVTILREARATLPKLVMLWSIGKDSNTMIWLARKAFFGRLPYPVIHIDTGLEFPEVYAFRDRLVRELDLNLIIAPCPPIEAMDPSLPPAARSASRKTAGLKAAIERGGYDGVIAGIRRDEQATRAKERVFSPRGAESKWEFKNQPPEFWGHFAVSPPPGGHVRVHPLLGWTEIDIWRYTAREGIPVCELYFAKDGKRFRSLGESDITVPIESSAADIPAIVAELERTRDPERAGRTMDHEAEDSFERLRTEGYM